MINHIRKRTSTEMDPEDVSAYEMYLLSKGISYSNNELYLMVGPEKEVPGWIIYVSVFKAYLLPLLSAIAETLNLMHVGFEIPINDEVHDGLLSGQYGFDYVGKIVCIYPFDDKSANDIANLLLKVTAGFDGTEVLSAIHLQGCVYAANSNNYQDGNGSESRQTKRAAWPFQEISFEQQKKPVKWLNKKYFVTHILKKDIKGFVYKALNFNKWYDIKWCVIKEGKINQCADQFGRSAITRIKWQFEVHELLSGKLNLPKPVEIFNNGNDLYFAMEYIEGLSFNDEVSGIQSGNSWTTLNIQQINILLNYLLQIIEILSSFHENGFVHRDLNPLNFIVDDKGKVWAIDIELCYNYIDNHPDPAFALGTEGYMSPAQRHSVLPVIADDIYGLGGIMLRTFTGCSPGKFNDNDENGLFESVDFFIKNKKLSALICACYHSNPSYRPSLTSVKHTIELYRLLVLNGKHVETEITQNGRFNYIPFSTILMSLWRRPFLDDDIWVSKAVLAEHLKVAESKHFKWYPDLNNGSSGILYLFTIADFCGHDISDYNEIYFQNFEAVKVYYTGQTASIKNGLYTGRAGFAILAAQMIHKGLIEKSLVNYDFISRLLNTETQGISLADGIAGQGLAILQCASLLELPQLAEKTSAITKKLISMQNSDGSWLIKTDNEAVSGIKLNGLFHGTAGVTYYLLLYAEICFSESAKRSAVKALGWLLKQRTSSSEKKVWQISNKNHGVDPWLEIGFTGIALVFIKAYQILRNEPYKQAASGALFSHPRYITSNYLSHGNGLSGLGEVYLEAYDVFRDIEWLDRATIIRDFLTHTNKKLYERTLYWLDGSDTVPSSDFMTGHAGIAHFLLRMENFKKVKFPLLVI